MDQLSLPASRGKEDRSFKELERRVFENGAISAAFGTIWDVFCVKMTIL